jgi:hypothetical protein
MVLESRWGVQAMKRASALIAAFGLLAVLGGRVACAAHRPRSRVSQLKRIQKQERKQLKNQEKAWKRSFRGAHIPRAERQRVKRQYAQYKRTMRRQQKMEMAQVKRGARAAKHQTETTWIGGVRVR